MQKYAYQNDWNPPIEIKLISKNYPAIGKYISIVNEWLKQDEKGPRKQRHTITRVFKRLQEECGYKGSLCYSQEIF